MYSDQDPERVMELLRGRGLDTSVEVGLITGTGLTNIAKEIESPLGIAHDVRHRRASG